jgi:hypothetical protein
MNGRASIWQTLCVAAIALSLVSVKPVVSAERTGPIRVYVSGLGNDSNASTGCPRANPCRTLATAYTVVQNGGEIIALDPADYGPVTITEQLSILGVEGAEIGVATAGAGITINAPATDRVIVKNFIISGAGAANTRGIELNTGQLTLVNSVLKNLSVGLNVSSTKADVINSDFIGNTTGIQTDGAGVPYNSNVGVYLVNKPPYTTLVRIAWGSNVNNTTAFNENNPTSTGGQPSATIWILALSNVSSAMTNNVAGYTTLMSTSGTGSTATNLGPQMYFLGQAPN